MKIQDMQSLEHSLWGCDQVSQDPIGTTHPQQDLSRISPLKILLIEDQNLRRDAFDFTALAYSDVVAGCQILDLSLNCRISVELPILSQVFPLSGPVGEVT